MRDLLLVSKGDVRGSVYLRRRAWDDRDRSRAYVRAWEAVWAEVADGPAELPGHASVA